MAVMNDAVSVLEQTQGSQEGRLQVAAECRMTNSRDGRLTRQQLKRGDTRREETRQHVQSTARRRSLDLRTLTIALLVCETSSFVYTRVYGSGRWCELLDSISRNWLLVRRC